MFSRRPYLSLLALFLFVSSQAGTQSAPPGPPIVSPGGLWQLVETIPFPSGASPPTRFQGATLDLDLLHSLLASAPPEGTVPRGSGVVISLLLPDGAFPQVSVASSSFLERTLQNQFPEIQTYAFRGVLDRAISGRLAVGPAMVYVLMGTSDGLLRLDPVVTDQGIFYTSYFDRDGTDGANVFDHPNEEAPPPPSVPRIAAFGANAFELAPLAIESGETLRIYRMTLGTTGQFYQARDIDNDPNNDDAEVLFSIAAEINNVNAVFEPELGAMVTDDCSVAAGDVSVLVSELTGNAMLGTPTTNIVQVDGMTVGVNGSVLVSDLTTSPAIVRVQVTAMDGCQVQTVEIADAEVIDTTPPTIDVELDPDVLWPPNHKMVDITANVTVEDNCPVTSFKLVSVMSDEPDDAQGGGDGNTVSDIQGADIGTDDVSFQLRAERQGASDGRTYTATYEVEDGSGNTATDTDTVEVPHKQP